MRMRICALVLTLFGLSRPVAAADEPEMKVLEKAYATSVANTLTQVFQRVILNANGNASFLGAPRQTTAQGILL